MYKIEIPITYARKNLLNMQIAMQATLNWIHILNIITPSKIFLLGYRCKDTIILPYKILNPHYSSFTILIPSTRIYLVVPTKTGRPSLNMDSTS